MTDIYSKERLYNYADNVKACLNIDFLNPQFCIRDLCKRLGIEMHEWYFETPGLRGMMIPEDGCHAPMIMLDAARSSSEKPFYAMHELIHYLKHTNEHNGTFSCYDKIKACQNPFIEWEANEGAAEIIMPYRLIIPEFVDNYKYQWQVNGDNEFFSVSIAAICEMANKYKVTLSMMDNRINNLLYEINEYCSGTDINNILPLSKRSQQALGLSIDKNLEKIIMH